MTEQINSKLEIDERRKVFLIKLSTANDVECASSNERVDIELSLQLSGFIKLLNKSRAVLVEDVDEVLQDLEVEGGCQQFTTRLPLAP